jgi:RES domain-containing protein
MASRAVSSALGGSETKQAWRIADRRHSLFDGTGAQLFGGRWNSPGRALIYAAQTYAGALLEVLVHAGIGRVPATLAWITIAIPASVAVEELTPSGLPGWDAEDQSASRAFGDAWLESRRSAVLLVPSMVTQGMERNVLINPAHADFAAIGASRPADVRWDRRLFRSAK